MKEELINLRNQAIARISDAKTKAELESIRIDLLGKNGSFTSIIKSLPTLSPEEKPSMGIMINETKEMLLSMIVTRADEMIHESSQSFDPTIPGIKPRVGSLHLVTQAVEEIAEVFKRLGFVRKMYPEVEWDWYAFEALNMPTDHAARDEWETFFIEGMINKKYGMKVLTPHTSSGQIREMEQGKLPIRMINIAKTYRRQLDISHVPMFHQFEGLVVDKNISVVHLKGTLDYFAREFFGKGRVTRLRPYHFQFTEPSFEVDISCGFCDGKGCKLCKAGWLELGGAGMVHPNVLKSGGIDPTKYSGFAFGWGLERTFMMKSNLNIGDVRTLYSTDLRYLTQF